MVAWRMSFEKIHCTASLAAELGLPAGLFHNKNRNPIGRTVFYDVASKVALVPHAFHHSTYPDQDFTLVIDGKCLIAWDKPKRGETPHHVEIHVNKETEHFDDAALIATARQAFAGLRGVGEDAFETPIEIRGRALPPPAAREPQEVIAFLNKFTALAPRGAGEFFWTISVQSFVPALVRTNELDALVQYGKATGWSGLTAETRQRFGDALNRLASEHRSS
jgi:hypothetical protein